MAQLRDLSGLDGGSTTTQPTVQEEPAGQGILSRRVNKKKSPFIQNLVQAVANPFTRTATTVQNLIEGTGTLGASALVNISGDKEKAAELIAEANEKLTQTRDFGFLGQARPVAFSQEGEALPPIEATQDIVGLGAELGTTTIGGGTVGKTAVKVAAKRSFFKAFRAGATKEVATAGAIETLGQTVQEKVDRDERLSILEAALNAGAGAGFAVILGGVSTSIIPSIRKGIVSAQRSISKAESAIQRGAERADILETLSPEGFDAVKTGLDDTFVKSIEKIEDADFRAVKEMFDIAKRKVADPAEERMIPREVLGKNMLKPASFAVRKVRSLTKKKNKLESAMPNNVLSLDEQASAIMDIFRSRGMTAKGDRVVSSGILPTRDTKLYKIVSEKLRLQTKTSALTGETRILHKKLTPREIIALRQRLFAEFDLAKQSQNPFSKKAVRDAEKINSILLQKLGEVSEDYPSTVAQIRSLLTPLEEFARLLGYKGNIDDISTKTLRAGEVARRLEGNAADRVLSKLTDLESAARPAGFKMEGNLQTQVYFHEAIERLFDIRNLTGIGEQVSPQRQIAEEAGGVTQDALKGNFKEALGRIIRKLIGQSDEAKIDALEKLLNSR